METFRDFILGVAIGAILTCMVMGSFVNPRLDIHPEAQLPKHCKAGEQVLMTTGPVAELYACEDHWVRK